MEHKYHMAAITINWGLTNSVTVGMVSFEDNVLKDIVYDMDLIDNILMYIQGKPMMKDACETFINAIISCVGTLTKEYWDHYHHNNASGYMRYGKSQVIATPVDKAELQKLFELYSK